MENTEIRLMKKSDVEDVHIVEKSCFTDYWPKSAFYDELKNRLARYFVAVVDGKVAGYAGVWLIVDEGHITNVAVHKDFRGRKIGRELVKYMTDYCRENYIERMTLEVRKSNYVAQNLYKSFGFVPGGIRKEYYADNREDAIIMWAEL